MPRGDKTGPNGMGQMTGRGLGNCQGSNAQNNTFFGGNRGSGFGSGLRRRFNSGFGGNRSNFVNPTNEQNTIEQLQNQINELSRELENLKSKQ